MSQRKGSLNLLSNNNSKIFGTHQLHSNRSSRAQTDKKINLRSSLKQDENNTLAITKSIRNTLDVNRGQENNFLIERCLNIPDTTVGYSSYRNSLEESLLNKLRKLGYVSNGNSKQNSPSKKKKKQSNPNHKRNFSTVYQQKTKIQKSAFNRALFDYRNVIGKGGFGRVWKVELKRNKKIYALKQMSKALIIAKKSVPSVMNQKKLLMSLKNQFLVNMVQSFQDRETLYLVMDYLPGGDLRHHIAKRRRFSEQQARFMIACIFLGLQYLHEKNIIHRDIKPENLVLDEKGYVRITDLGVARTYRPNNSSDTSGTPGYMAPQVLCRQNHTYSVDHFALGIIAYELMLRRRPYYGRNRKQIRDQILARQVQVKKNQIPDNWSLEAADFINRLIQRKPSHRLGFNSSAQIRKHPWLRQYPLDKIAKRQLIAPYVPDLQSVCSWSDNKLSSQNTQTRQLIMQNQILLRDKQVQKLFDEYESCG